LTIYIQEAHPTDEWQVSANLDEGVCYAQPRDLEARLEIAADFRARFDFALPLVADTMANEAMERYAAWPERLYVIDADGRVAYKGGMGPFRFDPEGLDEWLELLTPATP